MNVLTERELFSERLWPSASWWLIAVVLAGTVGVMSLPAVAPAVALATVLVTLGLIAYSLVSYAAVVRVDQDGLRAGPALLPWEAVGAVAVLEAEEARAVRGPRADPQAYLLLRAYVPTAVTVRVVDAADPTPYWYVSTRRPAALAAALAHGRSAARGGDDAHG